MSTDDLAERVGAALVRAGHLSGKAAALPAVTPILNWGGFVNRSFAATDGRARLHVKLAEYSENRRELRRWHAVSALLNERYRAPLVLAWVDIEGTPYAGLVSEWIEGETPAALSPSVRKQTAASIDALHRDEELADALRGLGDAPRTCFDAYSATYDERFVGDLEGVGESPPPFLSRETIAWMEEETKALAVMASNSAAFQEQAVSPSHGDLWLNNLIVQPDGEVCVCDWDDVSLGDPVMDWAMLFGPSRTDLLPRAEDAADRLGLAAAERERLALYARASLFDWLLDPLADWVEADRMPEHREEVRAANRRVHERALDLYRERYP
ncbi:MAG: aminoglycoside phosphotransferase family protein [Gemmatimonadota bacterium]